MVRLLAAISSGRATTKASKPVSVAMLLTTSTLPIFSPALGLSPVPATRWSQAFGLALKYNRAMIS